MVLFCKVLKSQSIMETQTAFCSFICVILFIGLINGEKGSLQDFRLPESLVPTHYELQLQPILDDTPGHTRFTAPGIVTISVNCTEITSTIKLHVVDLTIVEDSVAVRNSETGVTLNILNLTTEPEHDFFVINLVESLVAGNRYEIHINFVTVVSQTRLDGMYLDSYVDPSTNETKYVATTLFAAISARRCFPSFDEPDLKAVFSISLARRETYHSLSNMHQISTEPLEGMDGWYLDKFAPTMPMSTYLVAMIVSDMTYEEAPATLSTHADNTTIRVYAPYYFIERGGGVYAANQTKTVLAKFEDYYNSTFMLQKLDSVSLPRFYFSAMENWGLITYNDRVLLYFPGETTEQERYRITSIIAHEVSHHYFGNLVTCEWWTWIWLNEGFATYASHLGVEMTYPEFNPWDRFINDVYQVAMDFDSTSNTHPVANEPASLADIGGIYDDIAYEKGASLLRMMQSFLTEEVMQTGIRRYLAEKQFSTARQDDLFQILEATALEVNNTLPLPVPLKTIMDTWTLLSGYPLLRVSRVNSTTVLITQRKYQMHPEDRIGNESWWVPLNIMIITANPPEDRLFWISSQHNETLLSIPDTELFIVNPKSDGYYRTLYSTNLLQNLVDKIESDCQAFPSSAKAKLLDDYFAFTKDGVINTTTEKMIHELTCLEDEEGLIVWQRLFKYFVTEFLRTDEEKENTTAVNKILSHLKSLQSSIIAVLNKLGVKQRPEERGEKVVLRAELLFWICFIDSDQPLCKDYVVEEMSRCKTEASPFPADLEETYLCIAASLNDTYSERVYKLMENTELPGVKSRLLSALSCTKNFRLLQRIAPELTKLLDSRKDWDQKSINNPDNIPHLRTKLRALKNKPTKHFQ